VAHRQALHGVIARVFRQQPSADIVERLDRAQIANARMNTMADFARHPQLLARERWHEVGSPAGPIPALKPPTNFEGAEPVMNPIPAVGEHSDAILRELGFSADQVTAWRSAGTI
jgi:crotonobetainyl-CoA:carnitine CoA-transferase CaiB-like acyl-CoA transferase